MVKTPEQRALEEAQMKAYRHQQVARTKRLYRENRARNLRWRIAHLRAHGWDLQAGDLMDELKEAEGWENQCASSSPSSPSPSSSPSSSSSSP